MSIFLGADDGLGMNGDETGTCSRAEARVEATAGGWYALSAHIEYLRRMFSSGSNVAL